MIRKPHNVEMVFKTLRWVKKHFAPKIKSRDLNREGLLILGFPLTNNQKAEAPNEIEAEIRTIELLFKENLIDQIIPLTLSPVTPFYRRLWRQRYLYEPFELAMFSQSTDIWLYGAKLLFYFREKIKQLNEKYNKKITRNM